MFLLGPIGPTEILLLLSLVLWILGVVDILRSEFTKWNKIIWLMVVIFVPIIGPILYFLIGRKQKVLT